MNNILQPARVSAPGEILKYELETREWSQRDLAAIMGRPVQAIGEIIRGVKQITPETAIELAKAFDTSPELWINLETNYRLFVARKEKAESDVNKIGRRSRVYDLAPVAQLKKRGWITPDPTQDIDELEHEICQFLKISTLHEQPSLMAHFRCSTERNPHFNAQIAWLRRVEHLVAQQHVSAFNRDQLYDALPTIRACAEEPQQIEQVPSLLLELGIHIVFVPHLANTYIDGAAFYMHDHPVIALSLRYNRIDAFWFTLMHELAHIALGHTGVYLDEFDNEDIQAQEDEIAANKQARDWLIDPVALEHFIEQTTPFFSKKKIERFAMEQKLHPGIVLGRLQYDNHVAYTNMRALLVKVKPFLEAWIDVPHPIH